MNFFDTTERAGKISLRGQCLTAAMLSVFSAHALAQSQSIILNTSPTPTEVELLDGTDVNLDPLSGNLTATPLDPAACSATTDCTDVDVSISSFVVSPSTVNQGQNVTFSWSGRGAWSCEGSGLAGTTWNGTKLPSGSQVVSTASLTPDTTYSVDLECSNGPVLDTANVSLTVNESGGGGGGGVPQFCVDDGRVPPAGLTQDTTILVSNGSAQTVTWEQVFDLNFPFGNGPDVAINRDRYASLRFNTGTLSTGTSGRIAFDFTQTFLPTGRKVVTISECPGDFTTLLSNACRVTDLGNGAIRWEIVTGGGFDCRLQPNTDYYLNILYTQDTAPPYDWSCSGASNPSTATQCGDIVSPIVD
jgi:hypothetical protein